MMGGFERANRVCNRLLRRATAIIAATALFYMPLLAYAPTAHADTTISTNTTGGNGGAGGSGQYVLNPGPPTGGSAGGGGAAGDGSGTAASGGAGSTGYANPSGGGGGGSDGGGGGGGAYGSGAGGGGGGAGGVGATASSGMLTNNAILTGGDGGNGGTGGGDYYAQAGQYDEAGGGGGGGGGSGVLVSGGASITNNGSIIGGNGGGSGSGDGGGAYGGIGNPYYSFSNPVAAGNGYGGRGGNGITATSSTGLIINNNGTITGGIGGADYQNAYGRDGGYRQQAGGAGILGQNLTITNNSGGTISAGQGIGTAYAIQLTGGTNSIANSGTIGDIYAGADLSFQNNAGSVGNITLAGATNSIAMLGGTAGSFNLYGATTASGTFTSGVTLNNGATFLVTGADSTHDVSGITTFDNFGSLTVGADRSISVSTFTNENGATLTLNNGAQLIASTLNLLNGSTIAGAGTLSNGANPLGLSGGSISATVGGTGGLVKSGTGTLTLTGANTYTGGTTVNGGTLSIADGALGGGDVTLAEGTTIQFTGSSFTTTNDFHITGDPIFDVAVGTTQTVSGVIDDATGPTDPGVVEKTGGGTLVLSGANTYSGGTTIEAGTLQIGTDSVFNTPGDPTSGIVSSAIGTGTLIFGGGTLQAGVDAIVANAIDLNTADGTIDANGHDISLAGLISGTHGLSIVGSSGDVVTFANAGNSFSGGIDVTGSGVTISESANGDFGSGLVTLNGTGIKFTGADTYANAVNVSGYSTFDLGGNAVTYTGLIADGAGPGAVMVSGGGTLTLKNTANSYTGGTFISGGSTVSIDSDGELGGTAGGVTLGDATTTGTLAITQTITSARTITLNIGGGVISAPFGKTLTLSGQVTGSGGLTVSGPGGIYLTGNTNNYSGGTTIASGSVTAGRANVLGTGPLAIESAGLLDLNNRSQSITALTDGGDVHGGIIANSAGGAATLTIGSDNSDSAFSGVIQSGSGTISLVKTGTGTLTLSGANTYSGGTTIGAGTLQIGVDSVFNTPGDSTSGIVSSAIGTGMLTLNGGTLTTDVVTATLVNDVSLGAGGGTIDANAETLNLWGDITGSGAITITSSAFYPGALVELGGDNTYSGATTISGGRVIALSSTALSANSDYSLTGASSSQDWPQIDLNGFSQTIKSLTGNYFSYGVTNNGGSNATLTIAPGSGNTTDYGGGLSDGNTGHSLAIILDGASDAEQIFSSNFNTYSGGTTITSGILGVGSNNALGTGTVTLDGGTLEAEGAFTLNNAIAVNNTGGTIDANGRYLFLAGEISNGANGDAGTLTFTDTSGTGNGLVVLEGTSSYGGAVVIDSGAAVGDGGANTLPGGAYTVNGTLDITSAQTISSLTGSGSVVGQLGGGTLSVNQASGTNTFSGTLDDNGSNPLSLVKSGAGVMNLSGANTFTGGTTLNAGTLGALNSSALGSGGVTLNGGTLVYGNTVNLANAITLAGDAALEVDGTDSAIQSGIIGDNGSAHTLQKLGSGTLQLAQANTYTGTTKLTAGTLEIGDAGALGSSTILFDGGTLKVDGAYTIGNDLQVLNGGTFDTNGYNTELAGTLSSDSTGGALTIIGTGSAKISGISNLSGGAVIDSGATLEVAGASGLGAGDVSMADTSTIHFTTTSGAFTNQFLLDGTASFNVASGLTATLSNAVADAPSAGSPGVLEKTGAGTLVLSGANTYSGGTTLTTGTLQVGTDTVFNTPGDLYSGIASSALGTGTLTFGGGTLQAGGNYTVANAMDLNTASGTVDANGHALALTGIIGGTNGLTVTDSQGGGSVSASGLNTYSGGTHVDGAMIILNGGSSGPNSSVLGTGSIVLAGGTLKAGASGFLLNGIQLGSGGGTLSAGNYTYDFGAISNVSGSQPLTIGVTGDVGTVVLAANNSYTGATTIAGGTARARGDNSFGNAGNTVTVNDGGAVQYDDGVTIANALVLNGNAKLDVENTDSATQSGGISDAADVHGGIEKTGTGTLALTGANIYTGTTKIDAGTLEIATVQAGAGASSYEVDTDGTLAVASSGNIVDIGRLADGPNGGGAVTIASGTKLRIGSNGPDEEDATFSGIITGDTLQYSASALLTLTVTNSSLNQLVSDSHNSAGGIMLSGGSITPDSISVYGGIFEITNGAVVNGVEFEQLGSSSESSTSVFDGASQISGGDVDVLSASTQASSLTIKGGAQLTSNGQLTVAAGGAFFATPSVTVTGAGSRLAANEADLGSSNGSGTLTVADGATLAVPDVQISNGSTFNIGDGGVSPILDSSLATIESPDSSNLGSKVVVNVTGDITLAARLTGSLTLEAKGGDLILANAVNGYSGLTIIDSGATLTVGNGTQDGALGTAAVTDNGTLAFDNGSATTISNVIAGSGGLTQKGSGQLNLAVQQNYTGVTSITDGSTLALTGTASIQQSSEVADAGTFDISALSNGGTSIKTLSGDGTVLLGDNTLTITNGSTTFTGTIDDGGAGGSITISGGTQILGGTNSWSGTTTVQANTTLTVASPQSLGSGAIKFYDGSTIKFLSGGTYTQDADFAQQQAPVYDTNGNSVTWSGLLTGVGDLGVTGGGRLILTNAGNSYANGTEVYGNTILNISADGNLGGVAPLQLGDASTSGTLQYGASFALNTGRAITLNAGGGVIDTNGFDATIAQAIGGAGALTKSGNGMLTLTGTSTYTGATTVNGGTLLVDGSIAASNAVTVASSGTLGGSGTVGATSVASGGTVAPGGSNTLHVSGALTLANGAATIIAVMPTASGQIAATGAVALDGTLAISQGVGTYTAGSSFKLITASSVTGTFDAVTGVTFTGLDSSVVYSATGVELDLATPAGSGGSGGGGGSGSGSGGGSVVTKFLFDTYGKTPNQIAAGKALAAGDSSGALYVAMGNIVKTDTAGVPAALGQLSGDIHASVRSAMIEDSRMVRDTVLDHVQFAGQDVSIWGAGFYSNGGIDSDGNASALNHNSSGFLAGVDMPFGDDLRAGVGGGIVSSHASEPGRASTESGSNGHVIAYAGWNDGALTMRLGGDYGWGDMDLTRRVSALSETNRTSERQRVAQVFGEAAYLFQTDAAQIQPYADIAHISARTGAFAEKGGVSAVSGTARNDDATYATLGVRVSLADVKLDGTSIVPKLGIGWQHAFDRFTPDQVLTLQDAAQAFTVQGVLLKPDSAVVQAGIGVMLSPGILLDLSYDGAFSATSHDHGIRGELRWSF